MKSPKLIIAAVIGVVAVVALALFMKQQSPTQETPPSTNTAAPTAQQTYAPVTDLKIEDLKVGTGTAAEPGNQVEVHYTGWLTNGTKFDSSVDRGQKFRFRLSKEGAVPPSVIQGWDKGILGMKVGGKRRLIIPPQLGYGETGAPPTIPPNSTLVFEVELFGVEK